MDIYITKVPQSTNHVELKLFLTDSANQCDIFAFHVFKRKSNRWAVLTSPCEYKAHEFLKKHGGRMPKIPLRFKEAQLHFEKSKNQPDKLNVRALEEKDADMRAKRLKQPAAPTPQSSSSAVRFVSLQTGVWEYSSTGQLLFDGKPNHMQNVSHENRTATVGNKITFGRHALAVSLDQGMQSTLSARIDIPYDILEHVIVSNGYEQRGAITLTLKSPPKVYSIRDSNDPLMALLLSLSFDTKAPRMVRETSLWDGNGKNTALCMVYRFVFPDIRTADLTLQYINRIPAISQALFWKSVGTPRPTESIEAEYEKMAKLLDMRCSDSVPYFTFSVRFQLLALVLEGTLSPNTMAKLIPSVRALCQRYITEPERVARGVRMLQYQIPTPSPYVEAKELDAVQILHTIVRNISDDPELGSERREHEHLVLTYQATITPSGLLLRGPDASISNRILRKYAARSEYFLRVTFTDEDGTPIRHDPRASHEKVYSRFRSFMIEGIDIAGRLFTFLGFSHSSLREHSAWFMAPFKPVGSQVEIHSKDVIEDLGDFSHIHCSAKCAARIGQAFSDTIHAVSILNDVYVDEKYPDIERNGRCFSDGCGLISRELLEHVWSRLPYQKRVLGPTILQIRYRGAKGVVALDSTLPGKQLLIRKSMTKYTAKETWRDLEICDANYRPLRPFLNQQYIKILEDLGVPAKNFAELQKNALARLAMVVNHPINAASFLETSRSGVAARIPALIMHMHEIGLDFRADRFLTDVIEVAIMTHLRDMKYRARIPIEHGHLLYGIVDHTNELKEGEVYVTTANYDEDGCWRKATVVSDRLVVTRAPALHPGDIQVAKGVDVSQNSPLRELRNCIVFSQQGKRDLASQLSGGDLDGDTYLVIYDPRLVPAATHPPADYPPTAAKDLGRPVQVHDIVNFFIDFQIADRLGQISNMHKIRADKYGDGTMNPDCIQLAELASEAVDFSKSGNPVDMKRASRGSDHIRPDWMAPGPHFVMSKQGAAELEEEEGDDPDDPDAINVLDPERMAVRYYVSNKVLGQLYRGIDEAKILSGFKKAFDNFQRTGGWGGNSLLTILENYIERETRHIEWKHHIRFATELREYYEENLLDIIHSYRTHREKPLTELEVFSGNLLAKKERASSRFMREANNEVRERFDRDVMSITKRIVTGDWADDDGDPRSEALPRAIACFNVSMETQGWPRNEKWVYFKSWKYVAASVCLEQLKRYHNVLSAI